MQTVMPVSEIMALIQPLSLSDKSLLIQRIALEITKDLQIKSYQPRRKSLRGILNSAHITDHDIATARQEMWGEFSHS